MKKLFISLFLIFLIGYSSIYAQSEKFKALFIYNFIKNIEWPSNYKQGDFVIGVFGSSPITKELESIAKVQKAGNQTMVVKSCNSASDAENCNLIFITSSKSDKLDDIISKVNGKSPLIVSDKSGQALQGAGISFVMDGDKIKYEISRRNIEKYGLKISNTLLTLGTVVN